MSDVQDMTSQMAKELMLGIRDSVEDVASAFKKMAIVNHNRHAPALPKPEIQEVKQSVTVTVMPPVRKIDPETAARYAVLLEEQKKRKKPKKVAADENQLTLFDFVA